MDEEIIDIIRAEIQYNIHTMHLGKVLDINPMGQLKVEIQLDRYYRGKKIEKPIIEDVRVLGSEGTSWIYIPIKKGDFVTLLFSGRDIDEILYKGEEATLAGKTNFDLRSCIALPGTFVGGLGNLTGFKADTMIINTDKPLEMTASKVMITVGATVLTISDGKVDVKADACEMSGTLKVVGDVEMDGNLIVKKDITAENVTGKTEVTAKNIPVTKHQHGGNLGAPTTPPTPGGDASPAPGDSSMSSKIPPHVHGKGTLASIAGTAGGPLVEGGKTDVNSPS